MSAFLDSVRKLVAEFLISQKPLAFWGNDPEILAHLHSQNLLKDLNAIFIAQSEATVGLPILGRRYENIEAVKKFLPEKIIILPAEGIGIYEQLTSCYKFAPHQILMHPNNFNNLYYSADTSVWDARSRVPHHIAGGIGGDVSIHLYDALKHIAHNNIPGDIINLGVYQGWSMHLLAQLRDKLGLQDRKLWGFDTFGGFTSDDKDFDFFRRTTQSLHKEWHNSSDSVFQDASMELVQNNLKGYNNIELIKGDIAKTVTVLRDVPVALALFDMDDYTPTHVSLQPLYERLSPGGCFVLDHHHWASLLQGTCLGQRLAMLKFNEDQKLFNPLGTNLFIKI